MSRVAIALPSQFIFTTSIAVCIGDINYGNHLANDAVLRLCHEARLRFLRRLGYSEMDVAGTGLIMADAAIQFKGQAFHGDVLHFALGVADIGSAGFALVYRICRLADQTEIAVVKNGMVFFDYTTQKVSKTPAAFTAAISALAAAATEERNP